MLGKHVDYDAEPVEYCARCYSLKIGHEDAGDTDYCMDCGSTEVATTDIRNWERLYQGRYGHKFVERSSSPRNSIYFTMSISELKNRIFNSEAFYRILYALYPHFPSGLTKTEEVILLFDKLSRDNRIDDARLMLYNSEMRDGRKQ